MDMYCYNQASIFISNNVMFHEHAKHIEVNGNFIQNSLIKKQIDTHHYFYLHLPIKQKKKKKKILSPLFLFIEQRTANSIILKNNMQQGYQNSSDQVLPMPF